MGRPATLRINIIANAKKATGALRDVDKGFSRVASNAKNHAVAIGAAFAGLAAAGIGAAKAAAAEESAQVRLATALRNSAGATGESIAAVETWIDKVKYGSIQSDDTLRPALARLVGTTKDVTDAQKLLTIAMDISAATGKPLETVSVALAKAYAGNETALKRLIPGLDTSTIESGNLSSITKILGGRFRDADKAASDTAEGGLQDFQDATGDAYEEIGKRLLPIARDFTKWATSPEGKDAIEDIATAFAAVADATADVVAFIGKLDDFVDKVADLNEQVKTWTSWPDNVWRPTWPWERSAASTAYGARAFGVAAGGPSVNTAGFSGRQVSLRQAPAPIVVNVTGALDPVAVAAQIRAILDADSRRRGVR